KYVETPQGLFELKFFFHSGIASGDGEMVSSVSVKKMIQDLLANEDPSKPLSDQEVALILKGRGLTIARRTVAKYREELGILPSPPRARGETPRGAGHPAAPPAPPAAKTPLPRRGRHADADLLRGDHGPQRRGQVVRDQVLRGHGVLLRRQSADHAHADLRRPG